jgi:hypothetical protein
MVVGNFVPFTPMSVPNYSGTARFLKQEFAVDAAYAAHGRWALMRCIQSLGASRILVPAYICHTIVPGIRAAGARYSVYDIDERDLNGEINSLSSRIDQEHPDCVLAASMYGNAAALEEIEQLCRQKRVALIDDAAQSFGSTLGGRAVGTFGEMGFFSFSPGKPTAAHMGAFYWANSRQIKTASVPRKRHYLSHYLSYRAFLAMRARVYERKPSFVDRGIGTLSARVERLRDAKRDEICGFEDRHLERVLWTERERAISIRRTHFETFRRSIPPGSYRLVTAVRGLANPHKIVLLFDSPGNRDRFRLRLSERRVFSQPGYRSLDWSGRVAPVSAAVQDRILELPIDEVHERFEYMIETVRRLR